MRLWKHTRIIMATSRDRIKAFRVPYWGYNAGKVAKCIAIMKYF